MPVLVTAQVEFQTEQLADGFIAHSLVTPGV